MNVNKKVLTVGNLATIGLGVLGYYLGISLPVLVAVVLLGTCLEIVLFANKDSESES